MLQYFQPALSYHLSLRPLFYLFLSDRLRQVSLYIIKYLTGDGGLSENSAGQTEEETSD